MSDVIKISAPNHEFWEIPVLFEDEHLLALDKPPGLLLTPEVEHPEAPSLMNLLHGAISRGAPWAKSRNLSYLAHAFRLDPDISGLILLAKSKSVFVSLANTFGSELPQRTYAALVQGSPETDTFHSESKLAPDPLRLGLMRVDPKGKRSRTNFSVRERFMGYTLLECQPLTDRRHQMQVHLRQLRLRIVGDNLYSGPTLLLSALKSEYRLKPGRTERPLLSRTALHHEKLTLNHPVTGNELTIVSPWPKDLTVAIKYLRRYASLTGSEASAPESEELEQ